MSLVHNDDAHELKSKLRTTSSRKAPQNLKWSNVNFVVKDKLNILTECWGEVPAGKVCAIMGPSGAGKSSLLNVLAGRSASAPGISVTGNVEVGNTKVNPVKFRKNIAYVMQDDAITPTATPREALTFSASMRLPASTSREDIDVLVTDLLKELGLEDCADTMVGGAMIKGISGGQRKRTSVGIEVITQPSLLFLDEPTSGLDSHAAFNCVKLLKTLASDNAAVLCTIHQPSSEVFHLFDLVIIMKSGRILYHGEVSSLVNHLATSGFHCPQNYNPADFSMFICQTTSVEDLEKSGVFMAQKDVVEKGVDSGEEFDSQGSVVPAAQASFGRQLSWLCYRQWLDIQRDIAALIGRFGITIFLNVLFGIIFFNAGSKDDSDPNNFNSHFGALTMMTISAMFGTAQPILLSFPFERPTFLREYSTGSYGIYAYILCKTVMELPLAFAQTILAYIICYFMMGLNGNFILMVLISWGLGINASSMALLVGCLVTDVKQTTELAPLLYVPQLLFAGFFIKTSQIPLVLRWAQYLCALKYAMNLLLLVEFSLSNKNCKGDAKPFCESVISTNDVSKENFWVYILILGALFFGFRILGGLFLVQRAKRFY